MSRETALVTTDWVIENLKNPHVVFVEVDEDTTLYEQGHIEGAITFHWRDDLQDGLVRDLISKEKLALRLAGINDLAKGFTWDEIVPVSAAIHSQIDLLANLIGKTLPIGPAFYPEDMTSDQGQDQLICELIREAAMRDAREELPHSIMVTIDEMAEREKTGSRPFFDIHATIHVERDSQTGIILGHKGERLKDIGMRARADIERELGARIFLGLHVKVSKEWQRDPKLLERLGFTER